MLGDSFRGEYTRISEFEHFDCGNGGDRIEFRISGSRLWLLASLKGGLWVWHWCGRAMAPHVGTSEC